MKRKIFGFMSLNLLLGIGLLSGAIIVFVSMQIDSQIKRSLETERITIISQTGDVLYDNYANLNDLENHLDRPEVADAIVRGYGESSRYSDTLLQKTYYYAVRLSDGNILRLSIILANVYAAVYGFVPAFVIIALFVLFISFIAARSFTQKIIEPINNIDLSRPEFDAYDELAPFIREIIRQKEQNAKYVTALENRTNMIETIIGAMQEGLILTDKKGVILSANQSAEALFDKGAIKGKKVIEICREVSLIQNMNKSLQGDNTQSTFVSAAQTYALYINPVYDNNLVSGVVILFFNITGKLEAEKHRKEFTANASHELKTPLTTISALIEMFEKGMIEDEDKQEFFKKISLQTKRLISMIDDIIKLSQLDEGGGVGEHTTFDVRKAADTIVYNLTEKAKQADVSLQTSGGSVKITANKRMIEELLYNLINNGIQYNKKGGSVTVSVEDSMDMCKLTVSDTGIGIPDKHINRVFERFYTVDKSHSKKQGGTGLGLSIVKHIVRAHNGKISIQSAVGIGTSVICYLPREDFYTTQDNKPP